MGREPQGVLSRAAQFVVLAPIKAYRRVISPLIGPRCRYHPSCSEYAVQAVTRYGILRGLVLAGWRILRCNPLSDGGYDPVTAQKLFNKQTTHQKSCKH